MDKNFPQFINRQDIYKNIVNTNAFQNNQNPTSFGVPVIMKNQYDKPELLYDNVSSNVIVNTKTKYFINIDSSDRDITVYTNPFNYKVKFNPLDTDSEPYLISARTFENIESIKVRNGIFPKLFNLTKTSVAQSGTIYTYICSKITIATTDDEIEALLDTSETVGSNTVTYVNIVSTRSTTSPYLLTDWTIEFIIDLDTTILYSYTYSNSTETYFKYQYSTTKDLSQDRFMLLNIAELKDSNINTTNSDVAKSFAILYPDVAYDYFYHIKTFRWQKNYKLDDLRKLSRISVSFKDSYGATLSVSNLNFDITTGRSCECTSSINYRCACNYIRHPYYHKLQHSFVLELIVLDANIDRLVRP